MKQVAICYGCKKVVGLFGGRSFQVEVNETVNTTDGRSVVNKFKARLCKGCTSMAGYKVTYKGLNGEVGAKQTAKPMAASMEKATPMTETVNQIRPVRG